MRRTTKPIGILVCLSLLALQLSGLHAHADASGYVGTPASAYTHSHAHHDHAGAHDSGPDSGDAAAHGEAEPAAPDHEHAHDVPLLDIALGSAKIPLAIPGTVPAIVLVDSVPALADADIAYPVLSGRHTRWRPPLRAPPLPA